MDVDCLEIADKELDEENHGTAAELREDCEEPSMTPHPTGSPEQSILKFI